MNARPAILLGLLLVGGGVALAMTAGAAPKKSGEPLDPSTDPAAKGCDKAVLDANTAEQHVIELLSVDKIDQEALCAAYHQWVILRSLAADNGCALPDTEVPDMPECEG